MRQGRLLRPRLDAFMGYFLTVFLQREVQAHQLFPAVRAHVGNNPDRAEELLREVTRYAVVYEELDNSNAGDDLEQQRRERTQIVDTTTMTRLLLWLFANTQGVGRARHGVVSDRGLAVEVVVVVERRTGLGAALTGR